MVPATLNVDIRSQLHIGGIDGKSNKTRLANAVGEATPQDAHMLGTQSSTTWLPRVHIWAWPWESFGEDRAEQERLDDVGRGRAA
ncbi:Hypothetical predicted protein [Paramuricea clavata]|uniref:Uncharacterized protein n=1 Tax=Paramuricea clavata TaxID=317549 RepID=A0A6S7JGT6_PARCT|nr:Hypothetical predicted protein [Paramuricea clavata]